MYVFREIWQNNVANGSGMLCSVLREICRKPRKQRKYQYWWPENLLLQQPEKRKHFQWSFVKCYSAARENQSEEKRLEKTWTLACPSERQLSKYACPGQVLRFSITFIWQMTSPILRLSGKGEWKITCPCPRQTGQHIFEPVWYG